MRNWLRLTLVRAGISLLIIFTVAWLLVWWPAQRSHALVHSQLAVTTANLSKLETAAKLIEQVPDSGQIKSQQAGSFRAYAYQLNQISDSFKVLKITNLKPPKSQLGLAIGHSGELIKDTNNSIAAINKHLAYLNSSADEASAAELLAHQTAVSKTLVNVLEYSPADDTQGFVLSSADSQKRLQLAKSGLEKTLQGLQAAPKFDNDITLNQVISQIRSLETALDQLTANGNTKAWINSFGKAQQTIITNRQQFWAISSKNLTSKLQADSQDLGQVNKLWRNTAEKYHIN